MITRRVSLCFAVIFLFLTGILRAQTINELDAGRVVLPNGWGITVIGGFLPLGDLPLNISVSPDKKLLAVTNNGQSTQSLQLIDIRKQVISDTKEVKIAWYGLAWSSDSKSIYASGGNGNYIMRFEVNNKKLVPKDTLFLGKPWPEKISVAGIAIDDDRNLLYAVTKENNSLYVINITQKKILLQLPLGGEGYSCLLSKDKKILYASCWGCDKVILFDTEVMKIMGSVPVGDNPNELLLNKDGSLLYVANANDNSVSVIDTRKRTVIETLDAALFPRSPQGSTTNGIALSEDGNTLYIANADNNCLALFDVSVPSQSRSKGFMPTGWYPTAVRVVDNIIFVANGKGFTSLPNPGGPNPAGRKQDVEYQKGSKEKVEEVQYIGGLFKGTLSMIKEPEREQLDVYTQTVYRNSPFSKEKEMQSKGMEGNPVPMKVGDSSPIKYVFYIIKENRTYDQVLGDMPEGNGDSSLVLFGERITPNQHSLAREFVLLDNFYVNGEVSADGHNWSTGAYATDYLEKNWPTNYGKRGGTYDAEGSREIANNKNGFIWDYCKKYGVSYRTYAEFITADHKPSIPVLINHFCPYFPIWDQSIMDTTRFRLWKRDFDSLLAVGMVPQFNSIRFTNDHTEGLRLGKPTPFAHVADNDLAVGLFVDYLSHSSIWNESVIFIVEDDAQNGPDHVDAHRSPAYVAGGLVKRNFVDHTMYSTSGILRTIELILGLPPMSQYDASSEPMWRCFSEKANSTPFNHKDALIDMSAKNGELSEWQRISEQFDFEKEDRVPDNLFNMVLWYAVKGDKIPCPAPRRAAFFKQSTNGEGEIE